MPTVYIEYISLSTSKLPSEVNKHVEMKAEILVDFSCDDALSSQSTKELKHIPLGQVAALSVGNEEVSGIAVKRWHALEVSWAN